MFEEKVVAAGYWHDLAQDSGTSKGIEYLMAKTKSSIVGEIAKRVSQKLSTKNPIVAKPKSVSELPPEQMKSKLVTKKATPSIKRPKVHTQAIKECVLRMLPKIEMSLRPGAHLAGSARINPADEVHLKQNSEKSARQGASANKESQEFKAPVTSTEKTSSQTAGAPKSKKKAKQSAATKKPGSKSKAKTSATGKKSSSLKTIQTLTEKADQNKGQITFKN